MKTNKTNSKSYVLYICAISLLALTSLSSVFLSSSSASADTSAVSTATVTVSETCAMTGTVNTPHTAELVNGTYSGLNYTNGIGQTTLKVFCNDGAGFAIYAIGYTNDEYGNNYMHWNKATTTSDHTNDIATGIYQSGATTSSWSMKLASVSGTYAATIDDGVSANNNSTDDFTNWHIVPTEYKRVAYRTSGTDVEISGTGTGSSITVTYDAFVSGTQPAGTYIGQVKYTMVHPNMSDNSNKPVRPLDPSTLNTTYSIIYAPNADDIEGDMSSLGTTAALTAASPKAGRQVKAVPSNSNSANITSSTTSVELIAPNFKRTGYGFAGWSTEYDATAATNSVIYGPNETVSTNPEDARGLDVSGGAVLYPVWIAKETNATMQSFNSTNYSAYNTAPNGTVIALEDERDHDTYAVAKLADGKWWMIENLRLDDSALLTITNTNNPLHNANNNNIVTLKTDYANNTIASHLAASKNTWCTTNIAACDDQTMLNTNNTRLSDSNLTAGYNTNNDSSKWYGYGNYYNWYSATAGNGTYSKLYDNVNGDLCPNGWHLPYGGSGTGTGGGNTAGGFYYLNTQMSNNTSTQGSKDWRAFPNNIVYSGRWEGARVIERSTCGYYRSPSAFNGNFVRNLYLSGSEVYPGTANFYRYTGFSVRCVAGS